MPDTRRLVIFYLFSGLFTVVNLYLLYNGFNWFTAAPAALIIALLFFFSLDKLILLLVFLTPFSVLIDFSQLGFAVNMPTEPLYVAIMLLFLFRLITERTYDTSILKHPISIFLILHLLWMFLTSVTSEIPLVSFKYFLSRLWFVVTFFFVGISLFRDKENLQRFFWLFGMSLVVVVMIALFRHAQFGFERKIGYWVVQPFFNDHTHYSAVLALIAPFFLVMAFNRSLGAWQRWIALAFFGVFALGILFSYSRAAWVSLILAFAGFIILAFRLKFRMLLAGFILILGTVIAFQTEILRELQRNTQESSGEFSEHVKSISNITSDASNLERINRWRSAIRLFEERPVFGWGPGTYQLVYAPYQRSEDYTIITTNFGDLGNAHSEYLGPLAESGLPGMLLFILMALAMLATAVKLFKKAPERNLRFTALAIALGLLTYLSHGIMNNFLDTDEASVLFWGMMAILVAMDVYYTKGKKVNQSDGQPV